MLLKEDTTPALYRGSEHLWMKWKLKINIWCWEIYANSAMLLEGGQLRSHAIQPQENKNSSVKGDRESFDRL